MAGMGQHLHNVGEFVLAEAEEGHGHNTRIAHAPRRRLTHATEWRRVHQMRHCEIHRTSVSTPQQGTPPPAATAIAAPGRLVLPTFTGTIIMRGNIRGDRGMVRCTGYGAKMHGEGGGWELCSWGLFSCSKSRR